MGRPGAKEWYRNPSRNETCALGVAYQRDDEWKTLYPDFLFFTDRASGEVAVSIVDPHTGSLSDMVPKLRVLADYAEKFATTFERVWSVDGVNLKRRYLDLLDPDVTGPRLRRGRVWPGTAALRTARSLSTRGTTPLSLAATRLLSKSTEAPNTPGWSAQGLVSSWRTRTPTLAAPYAVLANGPRPRTEASHGTHRE